MFIKTLKISSTENIKSNYLSIIIITISRLRLEELIIINSFTYVIILKLKKKE